MADAKRVNTSPLSAREGKVYIDGVLVADSCKFKVAFKPEWIRCNNSDETGSCRTF